MHMSIRVWTPHRRVPVTQVEQRKYFRCKCNTYGFICGSPSLRVPSEKSTEGMSASDRQLGNDEDN